MKLDLSGNKLRLVPSDTLTHVRALRELRISGNPIERVLAAAFIAVPNLFRLEMSDCEISTLHEDAFRGLVKLQWLKLDGNRLRTLADGSLMPLNSIRELHLHGNPWVCDCHARYLRRWLDQVNPSRAEPPTCAGPARLRRRAFEAVPLSQFACPPRIREGARTVTAWSGDNVTLSCSVSASPEARVRWLWHGRLVANGSASQPPGTHYRVFEHGREEKTSMLTVQGRQRADRRTLRLRRAESGRPRRRQRHGGRVRSEGGDARHAAARQRTADRRAVRRAGCQPGRLRLRLPAVRPPATEASCACRRGDGGAADGGEP